MEPSHQFAIRVYYEDTDAGGIVYYANYLKFFERARTEMLRDLAIEQDQLLKDGVGFVVRNVEMANRAPARFNQMITVNSSIEILKKATVVFQQEIVDHAGKLLVSARIKVACVDLLNMTPMAIPTSIIKELARVC